MAEPVLPIIPTEYLQYVRAVLPLVAVGLGWWLRGFEIRAGDLIKQFEEITEELQKLLEVGSEYWRRDTTGQPGDALDLALEAEIQGRMHTVNELCESISTEFTEAGTSRVRSLVGELRQALTGYDFASAKGHGSSGQSISRSFSLSSQLRVQLRGSVKKRKRRFGIF